MSANLYFTNRNETEANFIKFNDESLDLNMSNSNAFDFLRELGLDTDFWNADYEIGIFFNSIFSYVNSGNNDAAREEKIEFGIKNPDGTGSATIIHCGRRAGYMTEKMNLALRMTQKARQMGATHAYFS